MGFPQCLCSFCCASGVSFTLAISCSNDLSSPDSLSPSVCLEPSVTACPTSKSGSGSTAGDIS